MSGPNSRFVYLHFSDRNNHNQNLESKFLMCPYSDYCDRITTNLCIMHLRANDISKRRIFEPKIFQLKFLNITKRSKPRPTPRFGLPI